MENLSTVTVVKALNAAYLYNSPKLYGKCFNLLFQYMRSAIAICDPDELHIDLKARLYNASFCYVSERS